MLIVNGPALVLAALAALVAIGAGGRLFQVLALALLATAVTISDRYRGA